MREEQRVGLEYLTTATELLRRVRRAHPTAGLYEAADLQWWWRTPRVTDDLAQLFWFDGAGRPAAAALAIDWAGRVALVPVVMPDATPDRVDAVLRDVLAGHGFTVEGDESVETWLATDGRPAVSPLADGYRLGTRLD